jgi:hypothetical protein
MKAVVGTNDTYVNIFLSRGFKQRRSAYGLKFFEHKESGVFITYDPAGIQTRVIISIDKSGEESLYEGDSISEVKTALSDKGLEVVRELVWD